MRKPDSSILAERIIKTRFFRVIAFLFTLHARYLLDRNLNRLVQAIESTRKTLIYELQRAKSLGQKSYENLIRTAMYFTVLQKDFSLLSSRYQIAYDKDFKEVYARHLSLLMHEYIEGRSILFGKEFQRVVACLPSRVYFNEKQQSLAKQMRDVRSSHSKTLKQIRNNTVGHRDVDGEKQLQLIQSIDFIAMANLLKDFDAVIRNDVSLLRETVQEYSGSALMVKEILKGLT